MKPVIISPIFNATENLESLINSIKSQTIEKFDCYLIDDMSTDNSFENALNLTKDDERFHVIKNTTKKFALKNIIECARKFQNQNDIWVGVVDGDDFLIENETFKMISKEYENGNDVVYTDNKWDTNNINSSQPLPEEGWRNPYDDEWRYSHFRTFRASVLSQIKDENFHGPDEEFVKRAYDQYLMLPMVFLSKGKIKHISKTCYQYNLNSVSIPIEKRNFNEQEQLKNVRFLRARGFLK